ncbi:BRO family protein [Alistipes putredinis]|uniref:BRO family protein n=1 Tax=Alistipes putredinis TaxID=28117 RepID=UPI003A8B28BB
MLNTKNKADNQLSQAFIFNASNQQVRTIILEGEPYFVAKDVCDVLGHTNPSVAIQMLDDDERTKKSLGRQGEAWFVNESGLYNLIFRSNKPEAKAFRKWVTSEVLPALRRTGRYEVSPARRSLRHPRRGEPITADILHLLWLIGESLHQGDQIEIAVELGVTRQTVSRVLNGGQRSSRILMALYKRAQANREADRLYHAPHEMAQRLLGENVPVPSPRRLPAVHLNCGRGAALGNQNARKHQSDR